MKFDDALICLLEHEGGYIFHPDDPGGETNFGISKRAYPDEDIKALTRERASFLYMRDYWLPAGCDLVPESFRFDLFDCAVNQGVGMAIKMLQAAVQVTPDGRLGPLTQFALTTARPEAVLARFQGARLLHYTNLSAFTTFGKGWVRRIAMNLLRAVL